MIVVMYHYIREPASGLKVLAPARFAAQLDWFASNGGVADARAYTDDPAAWDERDGRYLLTFDDGLREHAAIAEQLRQRGLSGCFFVCRAGARGELLNPHRLHLLLAHVDAEVLWHDVGAGLAPAMVDTPAVERFDDQLYRNQDEITAATRLKALFNYHLHYEHADALLCDLFRRHLGSESPWARDLYLDAAAIAQLGDDHVVGNHTCRHRVLSRLTSAEQEAEIGACHDWLQATLGTPPRAFCYPYGVAGTYDTDTLGILRRLGYRSGFVFGNGAVDPAASPLEIERMDCNRFPPT